jgi:hypothetical protein
VDDGDAASWQKTLVIGKPDVITYLHHAYPLAVAAVQRSFCDNWLFNNYLQLRCRRELIGARAVTEFDFYLLPSHFTDWGGLLRMPQIPPEMLWRSRGEITQAVLRALDREFYVQIPVDEFYVPRRAAYGKRHYVHELFVFGYDRRTREVDVLGFDEQLEFGTQRLGFAELEESVALADLSEHYDPGGVRLYHARPGAEYLADPSWVVEVLDDYLAERDSSLRFRAQEAPKSGYLYGTAVYGELAAFFASVSEQPGAMDIRPLQLIWEHKRLMQTRLQRLTELGWLPPEPATGYALAVERANTLRLLGLKYLITKQNALLERVAVGLRELVRLERERLLPVLEQLRDASARRAG